MEKRMSNVQIVIHLTIISIITIKSMSPVKVSVGLVPFPFESTQMRNIHSLYLLLKILTPWLSKQTWLSV